MDKAKLPFRLKFHRPSGFWYVRFRYTKRDYDRSTETRNEVEAYGRAQEIYDAITGSLPAAPAGKTLPFFPIADLWLSQCEIDPSTRLIYRGYVRLWIDYFKNNVYQIQEMHPGYAYWRAANVIRKTFRKEISVLRTFVRFLVRERVLPVEFAIPLPAELKGRRANPDRKRTGKLLSVDEAMAILAYLPTRVQDFFVVLYETGLRPKTVARLELGTHWNFGWSTLHITEEIDKIDYERTVPLTERARSALACAAAKSPARPLIFGEHDYRKSLATAAKKAGVVGVTDYDFRHSRTTHWLDAGAPLTGVSFLVGHLQVSTTSKYAKPNEKAARQTIGVDRTPESGGTGGNQGPTEWNEKSRKEALY
jgi:integrase